MTNNLKRLGLVLSVLSMTSFANAGITLSSQCSKVINAKDYFFDGAPADAPPDKIYNFKEIKDDMVATLDNPEKSSCLGEIWQKGLDEEGSYVGTRLGSAKCDVNDDGAVTGGCDTGKEPVKGLEASDKYIKSLKKDLNAKVKDAVSQAQKEEAEEAHLENTRSHPQCNRPNPVLTRTAALEAVCCGSNNGKADGGPASGAIGDLHPELNVSQCLAKVRPSGHGFAAGAGMCMVNAVKGWASGFWNALKSPFSLASSVWAQRSQLWSLMTSGPAREKFMAAIEARIAKLFEDKAQAAQCYNTYEKAQATCKFAGEVLGMLSAPDAVGVVFSLVSKPIAEGAQIMDSFLSKSLAGRATLATIKAPGRAGKAVWEAGGRAKDATGRAVGRVADKVSPKLRESFEKSAAADRATIDAAKKGLKKVNDKAGAIAQARLVVAGAKKVAALARSSDYKSKLMAAFRKARGAEGVETASGDGVAASAQNIGQKIGQKAASTAAKANVAVSSAPVVAPKLTAPQLDAAQARLNEFSDKMNAISPKTNPGAISRASFEGKTPAEIHAEAAQMHNEVEQLSDRITPKRAAELHAKIAQGEAAATRTKLKTYTPPDPAIQAAAETRAVADARVVRAQADVDRFTQTLRSERADAEGRIDPQGAKAAFQSKTLKGIKKEALGLQMKTDELHDAGKISDIEAARTHQEISVAEARARGSKDISVYVRPSERISADDARLAREAKEGVPATPPSEMLATARTQVNGFMDEYKNLPPGEVTPAQARAAFGIKSKVPVLRTRAAVREARDLHLDVEEMKKAGDINEVEAQDRHVAISKNEMAVTGKPAHEWAPAKAAHVDPLAPPLRAAKTHVDDFSRFTRIYPNNGDTMSTAQAAFGERRGIISSRRVQRIQGKAQALRENVAVLVKEGQMSEADGAAMTATINRYEQLATVKRAKDSAVAPASDDGDSVGGGREPQSVDEPVVEPVPSPTDDEAQP